MPALDGLSAGARDWVEVEPFVWYDRATGERLAAEVKDGRVVRMSIDAGSPFMVFEPAPAGTNTAWLMPALLVALGLVALARSEERRVGKEGGSTCVARWSPVTSKTKKQRKEQKGTRQL